jgi:hypothetical protein
VALVVSSSTALTFLTSVSEKHKPKSPSAIKKKKKKKKQNTIGIVEKLDLKKKHAKV